MPVGRPTVYELAFCKQAHSLAQQGATDREIAEALDVNESTLHRWKHSHPEFRESIKLGKESADQRVIQSLYRRAVGYSFDAIKIFQYEGAPVVVPHVEHVPPDVQAQVFWLKNRKPADWRDKQDHELQGEITVHHKIG